MSEQNQGEMGEITGEMAPDGGWSSHAYHDDTESEVIQAYAPESRELPPRVRNDLRTAERLREAERELVIWGERKSAERLSERWGISIERTYEVVRAALLDLAKRDKTPPAERRALIKERSEHVWRVALERQRALVCGDQVVYAPDPDLRAADRQLEFQSKLYGLDLQPGTALMANILAVAKAALDPSAYSTLVHALARESNDAMAGARAELPQGSGIDDAEVVPTSKRIGSRIKR